MQAERGNRLCGTRGGIRTHTAPSGQGILSPPRLPFRHPGLAATIAKIAPPGSVLSPAEQKLKQIEEFSHGKSGIANQGAERADGKFPVLRNGKVHPEPGLDHYHMAAHLAGSNPTGLLEGRYRFSSGDVGEPRHSARR
jgi:hypothetical protein